MVIRLQILNILVLTSFFLLSAEEESKPLLRIFPTYRPEECEDWAIRPFVCKRCLWEGKQYAQRIHFTQEGPYRVHGCYSEKEGFIPKGEGGTGETFPR